MRILTRQWVVFVVILTHIYIADSYSQSNTSQDSIFNLAIELKFINPDSSALLFTEAYKSYGQVSDTLNMIYVLNELSDLHAHNGNFGESYDNYWQALLLADRLGQDIVKARIYNGLGWLYILYNREVETKKFLNLAVEINKELRQDSITENQQPLINNYYAFLTFYRRQGNTDLARVYADSCASLEASEDNILNNRAFLSAEMGYILFEEDKLDESLELLLPLEDYFNENQHSYLVLYHYFLGKIYQSKGNFQKSKYYYESAIRAWEQHNSHSDITPDIYLAYSNLLYENHQYTEAYNKLVKAQELNELRFGSRSSSNQQFMEIKDEFRIQQDEKARFEQEQKVIRLEQEERISRLEVRILFITVGLLIIIVFISYRFFRTRYKADKKLMLERRKMEREKSKELLEVKNKELTASALQVIQKEETLAELKEELLSLEENPDSRRIKRIAKNINTGTSNNWKEFEARFISVNKKFYSNLTKEFPGLSQGDQKICALIKLNFTSKDMAKLLGISVESVHTTRYRLRKKLGLERSDNLEEFIATIG